MFLFGISGNTVWALGMLGGVLISHRQQGFKAAKMARRILLGEPPENIPVLTKKPQPTGFDYPQLRHYGISLDALPEDAVILHAPESVWNATTGTLYAAILSLRFAAFTSGYLQNRCHTAYRPISKAAGKTSCGNSLKQLNRAHYLHSSRTRKPTSNM